eukprot:TRINITY_DN17275_c0_g1_i7.p1 TRINITY_DN17275_c0_g1~~TRINITY_DN17275_c0_g1_i7.p1  ORF type:complete len:1055 (+),score=122.06 TRINITY_DN17275_c0_g1_i7:188-3352(+)
MAEFGSYPQVWSILRLESFKDRVLCYGVPEDGKVLYREQYKQPVLERKKRQFLVYKDSQFQPGSGGGFLEGRNFEQLIPAVDETNNDLSIMDQRTQQQNVPVWQGELNQTVNTKNIEDFGQICQSNPTDQLSEGEYISHDEELGELKEAEKQYFGQPGADFCSDGELSLGQLLSSTPPSTPDIRDQYKQTDLPSTQMKEYQKTNNSEPKSLSLLSAFEQNIQKQQQQQQQSQNTQNNNSPEPVKSKRSVEDYFFQKPRKKLKQIPSQPKTPLQQQSGKIKLKTGGLRSNSLRQQLSDSMPKVSKFDRELKNSSGLVCRIKEDEDNWMKSDKPSTQDMPTAITWHSKTPERTQTRQVSRSAKLPSMQAHLKQQNRNTFPSSPLPDQKLVAQAEANERNHEQIDKNGSQLLENHQLNTESYVPNEQYDYEQDGQQEVGVRKTFEQVDNLEQTTVVNQKYLVFTSTDEDFQEMSQLKADFRKKAIEIYRMQVAAGQRSIRGEFKGYLEAIKEPQFKRERERRKFVCGHPLGVQIGDKFENRLEMIVCGVHGAEQKGIYVPPMSNYCVPGAAAAICVNGSYADDQDRGERIEYTGEGGREGEVQLYDQVNKGGNRGLLLCHERQLPVRVARREDKWYVYEGLYYVEGHEFKESEQVRQLGRDKVEKAFNAAQSSTDNQKTPSLRPKVYKFYLRGVPGHFRASCMVGHGSMLNQPRRISSQTVGFNNVGLQKLQRRHSTMQSIRSDGKLGTPTKISTNPKQSATNRSSIICEDISRGKEQIKIPVIVDLEHSHLSQFKVDIPQFEYVTYRGYSKQARQLNQKLSNFGLEGCGLEGREEIGQYYNVDGLLVSTEPTGIFECSSSYCNDREACKRNSITQQGITLPLEVRWLGNERGFSITCREDIPSGQFVCEFIGYIITSHETDAQKYKTRSEKNKLYYLDEFIGLHRSTDIPEEEKQQFLLPIPEEYIASDKPPCLVIDAQERGNICRFLNHSCDPNLIPQMVLRRKCHGLRFHVCFFAQTRIQSGTELCYDHQKRKLNFEMDQPCNCGALQCIDLTI